MEQEPRMIDHWTVTQTFYLGDREVALAVDNTDPQAPYLVTDISTDNPFGAEQYANTIGSDDFMEAMEDFLGRVQQQLEQVKAHRHDREVQGVDLAPLGLESCLPNGHSGDFTDKVVVIRPEILRPEYRTPDVQLVYATHGNGCRPESSGRAVYCKHLFDGTSTRYNRCDVLGVADPKALPPWAVERLAALRAREQERRTQPGKKKDHEVYR